MFLKAKSHFQLKAGLNRKTGTLINKVNSFNGVNTLDEVVGTRHRFQPFLNCLFCQHSWSLNWGCSGPAGTFVFGENRSDKICQCCRRNKIGVNKTSACIEVQAAACLESM